MTNEQEKLGPPAGELSSTELADHKELDAVRTNTCKQCGTIFAVEILKCPDCSTIAKGNEVGPFSNYSCKSDKALNDELTELSAEVRRQISVRRQRRAALKYANDSSFKLLEGIGKLVPGMPGSGAVSRFEASLMPFFFAIRSVLITSAVVILFSGSLCFVVVAIFLLIGKPIETLFHIKLLN